MSNPPDLEQPGLLPPAPQASQRGSIARLALDVALPHLDRFFDYTVPEKLETDAVVGARVRARFAGRLVDGFIVERPDSTPVTTKLRPLSKVVSPEPVLTSQQVALVRAVADHYAGTFADVVRLAVPPRHAATEKAVRSPWPEPQLPAERPAACCRFRAGARSSRSWSPVKESGRPGR